jgi:hypothetical protein
MFERHKDGSLLKGLFLPYEHAPVGQSGLQPASHRNMEPDA